MRICVLGWYGTETLGDRAILAGIFKIFSKEHKRDSYAIGSLYPFYTERTLLEEKKYYEEVSNQSEIYCFDVKKRDRLRNEIESADLVLMGGGPLMQIYEMELICASFRYAKKCGKRTIICGCGIDKINTNEFKRLLVNIIKVSDDIILRDRISKHILTELLDEFKVKHHSIHVCNDPAFVGVDLRNKKEKRQDYAVVNLRDYSFVELSDMKHTQSIINQQLIDLGDECEKVYFLANHTFYKGGDDRIFLNKIVNNLCNRKYEVINKPLNLQETFKCIAEAKIALAMRYHAVLFQTLLNGNNYILDYTEIKKGKITGFLDILPKADFYQERYINIAKMNQNFDLKKQGVYDAWLFENSENVIKEYRKILII